MLETRNLKKVYKTKKGVSVTALNDVSIKFPEKGLVFLLGKSGSGKSTLLNLLGGLDKYDEGEIIIKGVSSKDFKQSHFDSYRNTYVGFIFQEYNVLEEFSVGANIALAIELQGKKATDEEINRILKQVDLEGFGDRKPNELSGGQKQRVAIGSAIIRKPKAFLMDEPLSNLDAKLRAQMRVELVKLHKQLDTTIIYVTHDQTEAMTLGTKIVVMKDGLIQQVGAPQSIYDNPVNLFVAGFLGSPSMNFFQCTVKAEENNRTALLLDDAKTVKKVYLDGTRGKQIADKYNGRHVVLGIRPEDIYELDEAKKLGIEKDSVDVDEPVVNREMLGAEVILYFDEQGKTLAVRLNPENQTQVGENVSLYFDMDKAHVFDPETEENLFYREEK